MGAVLLAGCFGAWAAWGAVGVCGAWASSGASGSGSGTGGAGAVPPAGGGPGPGGPSPASASTLVAYRTLFNGEAAAGEGLILLECHGDQARVRTEPVGVPKPEAPEESGHIDFAARRTWQSARLRDGRRVTVLTEFADLPVLEATPDTARVLGRLCRRWKTVIRSNQIDVWATSESGARGTPALNLIVPDGLVLRVVRNNNYELVAVRLEASPAEAESPIMLPDWGELVDAAAYRARVTESWVTTVTVFDREPIAFGNEIHNPEGADSLGVFRHAGGTVILRRVDLPPLPADAMVFAEVTQYSRGDAYDRTGSIFLVPDTARRDGADAGSRGSRGAEVGEAARAVSFLDALRDGVEVLPVTAGRDGRRYQGIVAGGGYAPPIELVRFITPFGIRHYNEQVKVVGLTWEDSAQYKMDVTDLLPVLRGRVWIGAFIGNYDRGGHILSLRLRCHPGSKVVDAELAEPAERGWAASLFNTVNVMEMAGQEYGRVFAQDSLTVDFEVPAGVRDCRLRFITTGHGGWENGDEFNPRLNEILIDGRRAAGVVPWRSDCGAYRRLNPSSGNFWNGVSSSDLSRSGWCPGAAVDPLIIPLPDLAPGRHRLQVAIPLGPTEGGSFSAWNVSGVLLGRHQGD